MGKVRARVSVVGRVQGVFFRATTAKLAGDLGLAGWVRNVADGSVEAVFQGDPAAVEQMIEWCGVGPPMAAVDDVEVTWQDPVEGESPFRG